MSLTHAQDQHRAAHHDDPSAQTAGPVAVVTAANPEPVAGLMVGRADATAEQDADALAARALRRLDGAAEQGVGALQGEDVHSHGAGCGHLRRAAQATPGAAVGFEGGELDASSSALIASRKGGGKALPAGVRRSMETAFGTGLGHVRVHDDPVAANLNRTVSAQAFTTGADIFFGAGQYAPEDPAGRQVLAHEIAHVVTEGPGTSVRRLFGWFKRDKTPKADDASKALELSEADELAAARDEGQKGRAALKEKMYGGDGKQAPATLKELGALFEKARADEKVLLATIKTEHAGEAEWTDDHSIELAYQQTWLEGPYAAQLASVAPPRKTASERLLLDVRRARTNANVRESMNKQAEVGSMLSKTVETTYEKYVTRIDELVKAKTHTAQTAADEAETSVWGAAEAKAVKLRPARGSAVERKAIEDARRRLSLRGPEEAETGIDKALGVVDKVEGKTATPLSGVGAVRSVLASAGKREDKKLDPRNTGDPTYTSDPTGIGAAVFASTEAAGRVQRGERTEVKTDYPESVKTQAASGISTVTSVFTGLLDSVKGALKFAKAVKAAYDEPNPRQALEAAKAGFDGLTTLTSTAKDTAGLAELIAPALKDSIAKVVPGLNIVTAVTGLGSSIVSLADSAMRMDEANTAVFSARTRTPNAKKVDVMVRPMLQVTQRYTKNLESASWSTGVAASEVITSIATVASAGGFGIPSAVQAGVSALDTLHSFGHFIADQVLAGIAKALEAESIEHLEGAAENQMQHNSGIAVDGIIMRGARGDKVAQAFLANYRVDGKVVSPEMLKTLNVQDYDDLAMLNAHEEDNLSKIRAAVLDVMGTTADPEYFYESWKDKIGSVLTKWGDTGELAAKRNTLDNPTGAAGVEPARGLLWRVKMMLKSDEKLGRSKNKTAASWDEVVAQSVLVECGTATLPANATEAQQKAFVQELESMTDEVIMAASKKPTIPDSARDLLVSFVQDRLKKKAAAGTGAP